MNIKKNKKQPPKINLSPDAKTLLDQMSDEYGIAGSDLASRLIKLAFYADDKSRSLLLRDYVGPIFKEDLNHIGHMLINNNRGSPSPEVSGDTTKKKKAV